MRRRDLLAGAGSFAAGATMNFPAPAIAQGIRQLKMVTDWPESYPAFRPAQSVSHRHRRRDRGPHQIEVFPSGALVRPFETFDAVGAGVADLYHSAETYFERNRGRLIFSRPYPLGSPRTNCSHGSSTAAARSCGTRSAVNSTSSRSCASTPVARWAGGLPGRCPRRKPSRAALPNARTRR